MEPCISYCEHGGVCELDNGHDGPHDSRYCKWTDAQAISREGADKLLRAKGEVGALIADLWDAIV